MPAGAPKGNTNSKADNRLWGNTIRRALAQDPEKLRRIAEKMLNDAEEGNIQAIREIGDRLDGKAAQSVTVLGDEDNPIRYQRIERVIIPAAK